MRSAAAYTTTPPTAPDDLTPCPSLQCFWQAIKGGMEDRNEVNRMPPGVRFLHPIRRRIVQDQAGQNGFGMRPADRVQGLKGLVGEVQHVSGAQVPMVGGRRKEEIGDLGGVSST